MKKVAIILSHPVQYYSPLFRVISQRGKIEIKVFYTWERGSEKFDKGFGKKVEWDIPLLDGYNYVFVSNNHNFGKRFWDVRNPTLIDEIENWGANAVMVFEWSYFSHLKTMIYFKKKEISVIFRGDSNLLDKKFSLKDLLRKYYLSWVYKHIDYALYVGENNKEYYKEINIKENQLVFAPHAIDNDRFDSNQENHYSDKAKEWRKEIGFTENDIVFSFVGKFENKKNPLLLIEAIKKINNLNIKLLLVGNGNLENEINEQLKLSDKIKIIGFQNQSLMPILYRISDIFVLPSKGPGETWGLAVNEAMACGLPVIVSDKVGCAADLVKDGINGYIFNSDDLTSLVNKMEKFVDKPEGILKAGIQSKKIINEWSFINISIALENLMYLNNQSLLNINI